MDFVYHSTLGLRVIKKKKKKKKKNTNSQSGPDSGLGLQVKQPEIVKLFPFRSATGHGLLLLYYSQA